MSFFEDNLAIMEKRDPELAALMRSDIDCRHIEVLPSNQPGAPTARVTLSSGETVLLHNMEDPIGSSIRLAEQQEMKAGDVSILLGFGLGYMSRELAKKMETKHPIIVCEMDPAILKTALVQVDLTTVLDSDYIKILVGAQPPLKEWISRLAVACLTAQVRVISYGPSVRLDPQGYEQLQDIALKEHRGMNLNKNTMVRAGRRVMENLLLNLPNVLQSAGVKRLENLFQGRPGIVVSAGPSLEKNVHLLRELEGRAVIIAVDTTLRLLLPLGIKPDIVTTIDFNQANFQKFADVPIDQDISLVYHPGGYYESIQAFHGPKFTSSRVDNRIPAWLMQYVEDKGGIASGTTVAHQSFFLARHMGCDPIVFIGQDLAFPKNQVHASDLSLWNVNTDEMEMIEDIFGEPVGSMTSFKHAIYHFEKAFKETQATIIDATEAGAKKNGARPMRLRDVIEEYCTLPPMDIKGILRRASEELEAVRMDEMLRDMEFISAELGLIKKECREILGAVSKLKKKIDKGGMDDDQFCKLSVTAEKMTQEMDNHGRALHLIGEHNYGLELYMVKHEVAMIDEIEDIDRKITKQVERAAVYYPSMSNAAEYFKKPLDRLIHKLKRAQELEAQPLGSDATAEDWYQRGVAYGKIEYGREALQSVQEALTRAPDHVPALKFAARLFLDGNRMGEALEMLDRLRGLSRSDRKLEGLVQETQAKHQAWEERRARLKTEFEGKVREESLEDTGWFYYRTKDYPKAVARLEQAVSECPTAEAYARLGHARLKTGDAEGAIQAWEQGLILDPTRPDLYKELGSLALEQGLKEDAEQFLSEACVLEPDDADVCERLARVYYERGAYVEAGACLENLLRLRPGQADLVPQIMALYQRQIALSATTQ